MGEGLEASQEPDSGTPDLGLPASSTERNKLMLFKARSLGCGLGPPELAERVIYTLTKSLGPFRVAIASQKDPRCPVLTQATVIASSQRPHQQTCFPCSSGRKVKIKMGPTPCLVRTHLPIRGGRLPSGSHTMEGSRASDENTNPVLGLHPPDLFTSQGLTS